ncbi:hypothetical protein CP532_6975 [Ophiocordyceps camponoti-leonardi (nom. inval.)]|nr:hypothetical protein CP532_6975 [Ophiocordyceps camponoti-leonardi (nom. inval.)]
MAPNGKKRGAPPADAQPDPGRQKRAKVHAARSIPVQPPDAAFKDGELDLQAFVAAHEFEIRALEQSMASSKAVSASRAFQKVPRGLRRRNASHNPKRIPRRLRARARREMIDDNTPTVEARRRKPRTTRARLRAETAKKIALLLARKRRRKLKEGDGAAAAAATAAGASEPVNVVVGRKPRPKIRRNQLNEPPRPAAKFRRRQINKTWLPTHAWHAKRARMTDPKNPLWRFAIPVTPNDKVYRLTHRSHGDRGTMLWDMSYMSTVGLYGCVAGVERVLKRVGIDQDSCWNERGRRWRAGTRAWTGLLSREKEGRHRVVCPATVVWKTTSQEEGDKRQVYLRVHPSAFLELFNELLRLTRMEKPRMYIEDLRFEIGSLELSGPASTEALLAVLTPFAKDDVPPSKHAGIFSSLDGLTNAATLPAGALLAFCIQDPRLRFPPRRRPFPVGDDEAQMKLLRTVAEWSADEDPEPSSLFDRDARHRASCLPSQKSIDRRRSAAAAGQLPSITPVDPPIPIMLIASRPTGFHHSQGSWAVLAPWKCIPSLWHSLVRTPLSCGSVPRFGGLSEAIQVCHERGVPWFPADFPGTDAGARWEADQRLSRRRQWLRRPKKPTSPAPPPEALLQVRLSLLGRGKAQACARIYRLPAPKDSLQVPSTASTCLPPDLRSQWLATRDKRSRLSKGGGKTRLSTSSSNMEVRKRILARQLLTEEVTNNPHPLIPSSDDLIGFVTSGAFNLVAGNVIAYASLSAPPVVADLRRDPSVSSDEARLCIVRNAGENVGWLARWEAL